MGGASDPSGLSRSFSEGSCGLGDFVPLGDSDTTGYVLDLGDSILVGVVLNF